MTVYEKKGGSGMLTLLFNCLKLQKELIKVRIVTKISLMAGGFKSK